MNWNKLNQFENRLIELEKLIVDPQVISQQENYKAYLKEHGCIAPIVKKYREYKDTLKQIDSVEEFFGKDDIEPELKSLAKEEKKQLESKVNLLIEELQNSIRKEKVTRNNVIIEIRAGTGGEEAALFASDLFRMYTRYAENKAWKIELIDSHPTGLKGFKEVVFAVEGKGVYENFIFESGTHRVQRVPVTESSGRIHTSTATIAVLPQVEEIELKISSEELRIDTYRASGHGGQHLQKTDSAVRITHLPTGIVVQCQDERSQIKNRAKAMKFLRAKLYDKLKSEQENAISSKRKQQVGTGERAEKIRTYNYPQNRITDHRANVSLYNLEKILDGELDGLLKSIKEKISVEEG